MTKPTGVPFINNPMALYETFRHDAESMALLAVRQAPTTKDAEAAYAPVHRLTVMVQLLSGDDLDAEGVVALIRKLQEDVAQIQSVMFDALQKRQARDWEREAEDDDAE